MIQAVCTKHADCVVVYNTLENSSCPVCTEVYHALSELLATELTEELIKIIKTDGSTHVYCYSETRKTCPECRHTTITPHSGIVTKVTRDNEKDIIIIGYRHE
jgi:hypothetical protein